MTDEHQDLPLKPFHVEVREVWSQTYRVMARTKEEAERAVLDGGGEAVEDSFAFSHFPEDAVDSVKEVER